MGELFLLSNISSNVDNKRSVAFDRQIGFFNGAFLIYYYSYYYIAITHI